MTSKTESAMIRSQLMLRINPETNEYEVYTTIHGSGVFRWHTIRKETARWYAQRFDIEMPQPLENIA